MFKRWSYSVYKSLKTKYKVRPSLQAYVAQELDNTFSLVLPQETTPIKKVPDYIIKPPYAQTGHVAAKQVGEEVEIKNEEQIAGMRKAGLMARKILNLIAQQLEVGMTTDEVDCIAFQLCIENKVYPSPLNYKFFPKAICTSVNNVACHGIPDLRPLKNGDMVNIDLTVFCDGFHGDVSETYMIGDVDFTGKQLIYATERARDAAISICKPGVKYNAIGAAITEIAEMYELNIVQPFCGHGIGDYFHGPPDIFHFANESCDEMEEGVTFTIEPILSEGSEEVEILEDGWTAVTVDGSRTAQFEHTVLITKDGVEVLTDDRI